MRWEHVCSTEVQFFYVENRWHCDFGNAMSGRMSQPIGCEGSRASRVLEVSCSTNQLRPSVGHCIPKITTLSILNLKELYPRSHVDYNDGSAHMYMRLAVTHTKVLRSTSWLHRDHEICLHRLALNCACAWPTSPINNFEHATRTHGWSPILGGTIHESHFLKNVDFCSFFSFLLTSCLQNCLLGIKILSLSKNSKKTKWYSSFL